MRADGGYVIWWPQQGLEVRDNPLADWPLWIMPAAALMTPPTAPVYPKAAALSDQAVDAQLRGIARRLERAAEGERNCVLFWCANRAAELVSAGKIERGWVADLLLIAASRAGLGGYEAKRTIESAFRGGSIG